MFIYFFFSVLEVSHPMTTLIVESTHFSTLRSLVGDTLKVMITPVPDHLALSAANEMLFCRSLYDLCRAKTLSMDAYISSSVNSRSFFRVKGPAKEEMFPYCYVS